MKKISLIIVFLLTLPVTYAIPWWNTSFSYRIPIGINNSLGDELNNYQIPINLTGVIYNDEKLVLSLHFSEGSGIYTKDMSGYGNHGELVGDIDWTQGKFGYGLNFNGYNDYVLIQDDDSLDNTNKLTIEAWVYPTLLDGNPRGIISKRVSPNNNQAYSVFFYTDNKLYVDIDGYNDRFSTNMVFSTGRWYHIAIVYDGSLPANERVRVYVNGELEKIASESSSSIPNYNSNLTVGAMNANYGYSFNGIIDEVRVYKRVLSQSELFEHYIAKKARLDYQDLRFVYYNYTTGISEEIPYWLESDKKAWVKVPYIPANTIFDFNTTPLFLYYGNLEAGEESNGEEVFEFFDDFEGNTLNLSKWYVYGSGYVINRNLIYSNGYMDIESKKVFGSKIAFRYRGYHALSPANWVGLIVHGSCPWNPIIEYHSWCGWTFHWHDCSNRGYVTLPTELGNSWHIFEAKRNEDNSSILVVDDSPVYSYAIPVGPPVKKNLTLFNYNHAPSSILKLDWIFVRKYSEPDPESEIGEEQQLIPWWNQSYKCRMRVNITNNNLTETLEEGYSTSVDVDTASLYSQGRLLANGNDLRVVYWNGTENIEIDRYNETFFDIADYDEPGDYVSRWAFDEGGGSIAYDSNTTSANDGTIYGATWTGGKYGNALHFDGTNDYVEIPNSPTLNPSGAFSLSVWFKADSLSDWQGVVSKLTDVNTGNGRGFNIQIGTRENIASLMADENGNWVYLKTSWAPETGKWYHVVLVHHSNNLNELYVNGKLEATNYHAIAFTDNPMQMGKFYTDANGLYFNGTIDEVKFYHRALTKEEIYSQYVEGKTTKIWFRTQRDIPPNGYDDNYFIYYGNPLAGEPPKNASNVFHYFDDFDTYSGWSGDVSEFGITTLEGENVLYVLPTATGYPGWIYKPIETLTSYKVEVYMRDENDSANSPHPGVIISGTDGNNWNGVYFRANSNQIVGSTTTGGSNSYGSPLDSHDIQGATWYEVEAIVQNGVVKHLCVNGSVKTNFANWNVKDNLSIIGLFHYGGTDGPGYFDKLTVKRYIYPEPTVTFGSQVCKYPDLSISSSDITFSPSVVVDGDIVSINVTVHNNAMFADANNFEVGFFLGDPALNGTLIGSRRMSVKASSFNTTGISWESSEGSYDIFVAVDYRNLLEESNESNNNASKTLVVEKIKLKVVEVTPIPRNVKPGDTFKVNVTVKNLNSKELKGIKLTLNIPSGWEIVDPPEGYYFVDIPANSNTTKEFTVKIPENLMYFVVR